MQSRPARLGPILASILTLTLAADARAQEPKAAPVRKQLDELRDRSMKGAPPERTKAYEMGIAEVGKLGVVATALKVGDRAPDFDLPDAKGKSVKLSELTARGPVVLTWYRGGWCPYCNIALRGFQAVLPEIREAGATLVAISPETPDNALTTSEKDRLEFAVLSDRGNKAAHSFGVAYKIPAMVAAQFKGRLDLARYNGDDSGELPLGATYVVDRSGVIRYAFVDPDYRKRAEPSEVVAALKALAARP